MKQPNTVKLFTKKNSPKPPSSLGAAGKKFWRTIQDAYHIADPGGLNLLTTACRCEDDLAKMRAIVDADGLTVLNHFNEKKPHPLLIAIRGSEATKTRAVNSLNLGPVPKGHK